MLQLHQITLSLCVWFAKIIPLSLFRFFSGNPHICRLNFTFQFNVGATLTVVWLRAVKDSPGCKSGQKSHLTLYFCVLLGSTWNGVKIGYIEQNCVFCLLLFNCEIILDRIHSVFRGWQRWRPLFHLHRWRCCCQPIATPPIFLRQLLWTRFSLSLSLSISIIKHGSAKRAKDCRSWQGSNLRGQSPLDFKSNALTTRPRLLMKHQDVDCTTIYRCNQQVDNKVYYNWW